MMRGEIVEASLSGRPPLDYFLFVPSNASSDSPLLVAIHGISRDAREQVESFAPLGAKHGFSVVAPRFDEHAYDDYQRLGRRGAGRARRCGARAAARGARAEGSGFGEGLPGRLSGGGQFVHRYVMAHPERVRGGIVAAAGWYTFPDPSAEYPYGIRVGAELPGVRLRPAAFLRVPMLAVVGDDDRERDENLRRSRALDRRQGKNRVERARRWVHAMRTAAKEKEMPPRVEFALLDGAGHSFEDSMKAGLGRAGRRCPGPMAEPARRAERGASIAAGCSRESIVRGGWALSVAVVLGSRAA